ncbi:alpha/beta hydrolase family protein [Herbidospora mongoliensis]|uniref:alpha/beta hydrolase family protein n=1 Tax=Herbidospora mongoliensis TaxID=688067 RepID=UPI00082D5EF8|nr:alpha/beta family hydrolase [Herbidospora mongoliensis]
MEIGTPHGPGRVEIDDPGSAGLVLLLTHGSAGGVDAPDLLAVRDACVADRIAVARVTQPFRLRGARAPGSAVKQDESWVAIASVIKERFPGLPIAQGGRSNGARVACRTAKEVGATAVVALAFPLHPPGHPEKSRVAELRGAGAGVLVISGDRDPFGVPDEADAERLVVLPGENHDLRKNPALVGAEVARWLVARR